MEHRSWWNDDPSPKMRLGLQEDEDYAGRSRFLTWKILGVSTGMVRFEFDWILGGILCLELNAPVFIMRASYYTVLSRFLSYLDSWLHFHSPNATGYQYRRSTFLDALIWGEH